MTTNDDDESSTSFLDLLSCAMSAAIILGITGGSSTAETIEPETEIRIFQTASSRPTNHLIGIRVGEFLWYDRSSAVPLTLRKHRFNGSVDCDPGSQIPGSPIQYEDTGTVRVASEEELMVAAKSRYGIIVSITQPGNFPRVVSAVSSDERAEGIQIHSLFDDCGLTPAHRTEVYTAAYNEHGRSTANQEVFIFADAQNDATNSQLNSPEIYGEYFCHGRRAVVIIRATMSLRRSHAAIEIQ